MTNCKIIVTTDNIFHNYILSLTILTFVIIIFKENSNLRKVRISNFAGMSKQMRCSFGGSYLDTLVCKVTRISGHSYVGVTIYLENDMRHTINTLVDIILYL